MDNMQKYPASILSNYCHCPKVIASYQENIMGRKCCPINSRREVFNAFSPAISSYAKNPSGNKYKAMLELKSL